MYCRGPCLWMVKIMKISSSPIETLNLLSMSPSWFWKKRVKSMLNMRRFCFLKGRASPSTSRTGASRGGRKLVGGSKPSEYSFSSQTQAGGNHRSHARRSRRPGKWSQERWWQSQEGCYRGKSLLNFQKKLNDVTRKTVPKTCVVILYSQNYSAGIRGNYHESLDYFDNPKKSLLK